MKYHDYYLDKYEVMDGGETVFFHLVFPYQEEKTNTSNIKFTEVALYNFTHTSDAIISAIEELPISDIVQEIANSLAEWNRMYSVRLWKDNLQDYIHVLQTEGYKAWRIESSIGFYGFIIAKAVSTI